MREERNIPGDKRMRENEKELIREVIREGDGSADPSQCIFNAVKIQL